jgi:RNA polymerase sigma factor (sigma-70 family)
MSNPRDISTYSFPQTQSIWSLVKQLGNEQRAKDAIASLLKRYQSPLKGYLMRRWRFSLQDAEDLVQQFIVEKIFVNKLMEKCDLEKGRFRSWLLWALDNLVRDELRRRKLRTVDLGEVAEPAAPDEKADAEFTIDWGKQIVPQAVERMKRMCAEAGRPELWTIFEQRLYNPKINQTKPASYETLVAQLNLKSPAQASNLLITAKRMFGRMVIDVIAEYETDDADIRQELEDLKKICSIVCAG